LLIVLYELAGGTSTSADTTSFLNIAGPLALGAIMAAGALRIARSVSDGVWTALFWFRVGTTVYFCFGGLVPYFGSEATWLFLQADFAFRPDHILKLNIIIAWSVLCVLATSSVAVVALGRSRPTRGMPGALRSDRTILPMALVFLVVGSAIKYLLIFPNLMGWTSIVVPGAIVQLADSMLIAFYLLTVWSLSQSSAAFAVVIALIVFDMAVGLLMLNKSAVLYPLIVLSLGILRSGISVVRVAGIVAAFTCSFAVLQPLVAHARAVQAITFGSPTEGSLAQRAQMLQSYFDPSATVVTDEQVQGAIARLSYTNVAAYVIDLYDRNEPGDSLSGALTLLVPRIFWPEKPIFTPGADLSFMMTGQEGNSVSAGLFAEAYWNFGWLGIPLLMIPHGIILTLLSRFAHRVMASGAWIYMPVLFYGLKMGSRVDGLYINDVIGASAIAVGLWLGCRLMARPTERLRRRRETK
jgi:hypothetical protein